MSGTVCRAWIADTVGFHGHRCTGPTICKSDPVSMCIEDMDRRDKCAHFRVRGAGQAGAHSGVLHREQGEDRTE